MAVTRFRPSAPEVEQRAPQSPRPWRRLIEPAGVALLLAAAVVVRIQGLTFGGPVAYDEGWAVANGRSMLGAFLHPLRLLHGPLTFFGRDWKPTHDFALGTLFATGVKPELLVWYSVAAGIVMATVLAALAWRRWGAPAGTVAGVIGAAAPLSVLYGHRLTAEADGAAGLAVVLLLFDQWWQRKPSRRLVIGTALAIAITGSISYRLLPPLLPLVLLAAWLGWWYRGHALPPLRARGRIVAACLIPAAAITAMYLVTLMLGFAGLRSLARLLAHLDRAGSGIALPFSNIDFYPRVLWDFGGPLILISLVAAMIVILWHWRQLDPLTAIGVGSLAGILAFFSVIGDKAPRAIVVTIPFTALLIARAVAFIKPTALRWMTAAGLALACVLTGLGAAGQLGTSGSSAAGHWLAARTATIATSRPPVFALFTERRWDPALGLQPAIVHPVADTTIDELRRQGVRYVVVDAHALLVGGSAVYNQLLTCGRPIAIFPDTGGWSRLQFVEEADTLHLGYNAALDLRGRLLAQVDNSQTIRIFDLSDPATQACS